MLVGAGLVYRIMRHFFDVYKNDFFHIALRAK